MFSGCVRKERARGSSIRSSRRCRRPRCKLANKLQIFLHRHHIQPISIGEITMLKPTMRTLPPVGVARCHCVPTGNKKMRLNSIHPIPQPDPDANYYDQPDMTSIPDPYDGAPLPPPRTSSQQYSSPRTPVAPSTAPLEARVAAARQAKQNAESSASRSHQESSRERPRDDTATAVASAARSRRKGPSSPEGPHRATSQRERTQNSNAPNSSRSEANMLPNTSAPPLVREYSEVINRVVVSDPRVDADRMQERVAEAQPASIENEYDPNMSSEAMEESGPGPARRQDYSRSASRRKDVQFGDYVLGQTLGEGEFGKVKLGWKKDGSTQVAIKLIRRDTVQSHPGRLPKIYREIAILRDLAHPNIVRLHEMVETERHIGIILEYASGGELFDYILNHRYLKDPAARRLFAQLVSGVGYLHKKGIVHRDLKLENLLARPKSEYHHHRFWVREHLQPGRSAFRRD